MEQDEFWRWVDAGYPDRWAFWRCRDEFDGVLVGTATGVMAVAVILLVGLLL